MCRSDEVTGGLMCWRTMSWRVDVAGGIICYRDEVAGGMMSWMDDILEG